MRATVQSSKLQHRTGSNGAPIACPCELPSLPDNPTAGSAIRFGALAISFSRGYGGSRIEPHIFVQEASDIASDIIVVSEPSWKNLVALLTLLDVRARVRMLEQDIGRSRLPP